MNAVTFAVANDRLLAGPERFTVFRIRDDSKNTLAHFETLDEAKLAAERFADKARYSGLDAHVVVGKQR